jgi:RNA polymerase sigma-70 factor (ECF subfamily)
MPQRALTNAERQALTRLVETHQARIRAFLCRFQGNPDDVDELTQDVFLGILPRCEDLAGRSEDDAGRYLRGVARNLVRLRWARSRIASVLPGHPLHAYLVQRLTAELDREPDDSEARLKALQACLRKLPRDASEIVDYRCVRGVSFAQIARATQKTVAALRMTLFRIRRQLRTCVESTMKGVTAE